MKKNGCRAWLGILFASMALLTACATNKAGSARDELPTSSDQTNGQKRGALRLQLAVGYYQRGEMNVALDEIKQALQADPDLADAYSMRGLIYMGMGETHLADENFQHALRLQPGNGNFSNNYGWFLCQNGRASESIAYFETALKDRKYTSPANALAQAGICSLKLHDVDAAEKYFLGAFKFEPGNASINVYLARLYYDRKDVERASFYAQRVVKADVLDADVLWLAIKIAHKQGDRITEASLGAKLHRLQPNSVEYAAFQRGAFDE